MKRYLLSEETVVELCKRAGLSSMTTVFLPQDEVQWHSYEGGLCISSGGWFYPVICVADGEGELTYQGATYAYQWQKCGDCGGKEVSRFTLAAPALSASKL
ncbi:MAG: hypothetical protein H0U76_22450 [Ktedonobacteraceae bacterium]|nr:hypothetical protein [Ktedonobacteraceae bacterium]